MELLERALGGPIPRKPRPGPPAPRTPWSRRSAAVRDEDVKKFHKVFTRIDKECGGGRWPPEQTGPSVADLPPPAAPRRRRSNSGNIDNEEFYALVKEKQSIFTDHIFELIGARRLRRFSRTALTRRPVTPLAVPPGWLALSRPFAETERDGVLTFRCGRGQQRHEAGLLPHPLRPPQRVCPGRVHVLHVWKGGHPQVLLLRVRHRCGCALHQPCGGWSDSAAAAAAAATLQTRTGSSRRTNWSSWSSSCTSRPCLQTCARW